MAWYDFFHSKGHFHPTVSELNEKIDANLWDPIFFGVALCLLMDSPPIKELIIWDVMSHAKRDPLVKSWETIRETQRSITLFFVIDTVEFSIQLLKKNLTWKSSNLTERFSIECLWWNYSNWAKIVKKLRLTES